MSRTSPPSVIRAYRKQFQKDFSMFLKYHGDEVVSGGRMVLTILERRSDDPCSKECCYVWDLLATTLNDMVIEKKRKWIHSIIPQYTACPKEVSNEVEKEVSFEIDYREVSEVDWDACTDHNLYLTKEKAEGYNMGKCMRAVAEPMILNDLVSDGVWTIEEMEHEVTQYQRRIVALVRGGKAMELAIAASMEEAELLMAPLTPHLLTSPQGRARMALSYYHTSRAWSKGILHITRYYKAKKRMKSRNSSLSRGKGGMDKGKGCLPSFMALWLNMVMEKEFYKAKNEVLVFPLCEADYR
nr:salicylate carboxymethyltransferase-like [Tanacetum cinerariifolium]